MSDAVPASGGEAPPAASQAPKRAVFRRAERVPLPRRLLAAALSFGLLALVLDALPRPYKPVPIMVVHDLGAGFDDTRETIAKADPEVIAGEAPLEERTAYSWALWRHHYGAILREIFLKLAGWLAAGSLFGAVGVAGVRYRRDRRAFARSGRRLSPELLQEAVIPAPATVPQPVIAVPATPPPLLPEAPAAPPIVVPAPVSIASAAATLDTPAAGDPVLDKLGFRPLTDAEAATLLEDDEEGAHAINLARRAAPPVAPKPLASPLPPAEPSLPIGHSVAARPVVRPGSATPPLDPTFDTQVTVPPENTVDVTENTVLSVPVPDSEKKD